MTYRINYTKMAAPTLEYTCSVCTCGKELSTIYYLLTVGKQFEKFAKEVGLSEKDVANIGFIDNTELTNQETSKRAIIRSLGFCCLMNLRYGIRSPVSALSITTPDTVSSYKYPEGLPGPLSKEKTLTWF